MGYYLADVEAKRREILAGVMTFGKFRWQTYDYGFRLDVIREGDDAVMTVMQPARDETGQPEINRPASEAIEFLLSAPGSSSGSRETLPDEEMDDFAFSVTNPQTGQAMKIYPDGQIDGFPPGFTLVINRIPGLVQRAADLGYSECASRIADARQKLFMNMIGELRKPDAGQ